MVEPIKAIWAEGARTRGSAAAIVTATGDRFFCTGADLGAVARAVACQGRQGPTDRRGPLVASPEPCGSRRYCAVNGMVAGAGLHFVVDADIIVAAESAVFLDTHVNVGMVGAIENIGLAKRLPLGSALRLTLCGKHYRMPAQRAYELGLVDEVGPAGQGAGDGRRDRRSDPQELAGRRVAVDAVPVEQLEMGYTHSLEYGWALLRMHWDHPDFKEGPRPSSRSGTRCGVTGEEEAGSLAGDRHETRVVGIRSCRRRRRLSVRRWSGVPRPASRSTCRSSCTRARPTPTSAGCTARSASATGCRWRGRRRPAGWEAAGLRVHPLGRDGLRPRRPAADRLGHRRQDDHRPRHRGAEAALPARAAGRVRRSSRSATPSRRPAPTSAVAHTRRAQGDVYVLNGEKRWTSAAHRADYLWVLCRTGTIESLGRGLTLLIVDRQSPGISIAPIPSLDGERFNEVRFDDVEVPVANRVGDEDGAWTMMVESLATERHVQFSPKRSSATSSNSSSSSSGRAAPPTRSFAPRSPSLAVEVAEVEALSLLMLAAIQRGGRRRWSRRRATSSPAARWRSASPAPASTCAGRALDQGTPMEFLWRQSISETIGGGTSEVMRGLIARVALGLGASDEWPRATSMTGSSSLASSATPRADFLLTRRLGGANRWPLAAADRDLRLNVTDQYVVPTCSRS